MGLFEQWPYTNLHTLNLDWILESLKELEHTIEQFVSINALKYADPIQWNIVKQYEKNTIVIDPLTGTAYISVQPVPSGVALTNTDYWTVVFDLGAFVVRAAKNFTNKWEAETTNTATFSTPAGDWLIWGDTLYKALVNITAGDQYVVNSNIQHFTMEDVIGHLEDLSTTDKSNLIAAINEVLTTLVNTSGDLDDLNTTDKSNLVAAINEVIDTLGTAISNAVSSLTADINAHAPVNVTDLGVVGDGITDNTAALQDIVDNYDYIYIPENCNILITDTILITKSIEIRGAGSFNSKIIGDMQNGKVMLDLRSSAARGSAIRNISFENNDNNVIVIDIGIGQGIIENCNFQKWNTAIRMNNTSNETVLNCLFTHGYTNGIALYIGESEYTTGVNITNCNIFGETVSPYPACGIRLDYVDGVNIDNCILNNCNAPLLIQPTVTFAHSIRVSNTLIDGGKNFGCRLISNDKEIYCVSFTGCWFTASDNDYGLQLTGAEYIQNVSIVNCEFLTGLGGIGVVTDNAVDVSIIGCKFTGIINTGANIGRGKHISVIGNNFNNTKYLNNNAALFGIQIGITEDVIIADNISTNAQTQDIFISGTAAATTYLSNNNFAKTNYHTVGTTAQRPSSAPIGAKYFDTDQNREVYWNGTDWINSIITASGAGHPAGVMGMIFYHTNLKSFRFYNGSSWGMPYLVGYETDKPGAGTTYGDEFYNRDLNTMIYYGNNGWTTATPAFTTANRPTTGLIIGMCIFDTTLGKPIWYKGSNVWVDATGTTV